MLQAYAGGFAGRACRANQASLSIPATVRADTDGDMDGLLERVMCCSADDEDRFVAIIHAALAEGTVEPLAAFVGVW